MSAPEPTINPSNAVPAINAAARFTTSSGSGNLLTARVQGSEYAPYEIAVSLLDDGSIDAATCTCPYDWGGYCKHIVSGPVRRCCRGTRITVKPELDTLLAGLTTEAQLRRIIRAVAEDQPAFAAAIEQEVEWLKATPVAGAAWPAPAAFPHSDRRSTLPPSAAR